MNIVTSFTQSGVWEYKNAVTLTASGTPLVLESITLVKNIYNNPQVVKEKSYTFKKRITESFTPQPLESNKTAFLRISKNAFILLSCVALMGGATYASFCILPGSLAITSAISSIFLIGKLFLNAKTYKKSVVDLFNVQKGEDPDVAKKRIFENMIKAAVITVIAAAAIAISIHFVLAPMLKKGFMWHVPLPFQTKAVVFAEYASIGLLNSGIACYKWKKGNKSDALYHLFVGALSLLFPALYWNGEMRLHHSFYGLLLMSTPSRPLRMLGSMITFDAALNILEPLRGYRSINAWGGKHFHHYDLINTIVDNPSVYAGGYAGALILENINDNWKTPN